MPWTPCAHGLAADSALAAQAFDLLILDLGLPQLAGLEVLRRLRARNSALPVLILTAADSIEQRVKGLDLGADDYMAKPFALSELEARVRALTRRGAGGGATMIKHGRLLFDQTGRVAIVDDQTLDLSAREVSLLEILLTRSGRMVSKTQLVDHLCEWGEEVSTNAIEVYVHTAAQEARTQRREDRDGARLWATVWSGTRVPRISPAEPARPEPLNQEALDIMQAGSKGPSFAPPQRSLLGEILDWMLAPLFLLWPMSVAITYVVAQKHRQRAVRPGAGQ